MAKGQKEDQRKTMKSLVKDISDESTKLAGLEAKLTSQNSQLEKLKSSLNLQASQGKKNEILNKENEINQTRIAIIESRKILSGIQGKLDKRQKEEKPSKLVELPNHSILSKEAFNTFTKEQKVKVLQAMCKIESDERQCGLMLTDLSPKAFAFKIDKNKVDIDIRYIGSADSIIRCNGRPLNASFPKSSPDIINVHNGIEIIEVPKANFPAELLNTFPTVSKHANKRVIPQDGTMQIEKLGTVFKMLDPKRELVGGETIFSKQLEYLEIENRKNENKEIIRQKLIDDISKYEPNDEKRSIYELLKQTIQSDIDLAIGIYNQAADSKRKAEPYVEPKKSTEHMNVEKKLAEYMAVEKPLTDYMIEIMQQRALFDEHKMSSASVNLSSITANSILLEQEQLNQEKKALEAKLNDIGAHVEDNRYQELLASKLFLDTLKPTDDKNGVKWTNPVTKNSYQIVSDAQFAVIANDFKREEIKKGQLQAANDILENRGKNLSKFADNESKKYSKINEQLPKISDEIDVLNNTGLVKIASLSLSTTVKANMKKLSIVIRQNRIKEAYAFDELKVNPLSAGTAYNMMLENRKIEKALLAKIPSNDLTEASLPHYNKLKELVDSDSLAYLTVIKNAATAIQREQDKVPEKVDLNFKANPFICNGYAQYDYARHQFKKEINNELSNLHHLVENTKNIIEAQIEELNAKIENLTKQETMLSKEAKAKEDEMKQAAKSFSTLWRQHKIGPSPMDAAPEVSKAKVEIEAKKILASYESLIKLYKEFIEQLRPDNQETKAGREQAIQALKVLESEATSIRAKINENKPSAFDDAVKLFWTAVDALKSLATSYLPQEQKKVHTQANVIAQEMGGVKPDVKPSSDKPKP